VIVRFCCFFADMKQNLRIVLTGGPGTGKTTLLETLASQGHPVFEEYSRQVIREELAKQSDVLPWANLPAFSERVLAGRVEQWRAGVEKNTFLYYDRSIIDSLAYLVKDDLPIPAAWDLLAEQYRYASPVFITPPWPEIYQQDAERKESLATMQAIHDALVTTYRRYHYTVIEVPRGPVEERVRFVLEHLKVAS